MATIITVHGTGATGPEEGQAWWQKGSPFEKQIRELVESRDGTLAFQPLIWSGTNSEMARRAAGRKLSKQIKTLQANNLQFVIAGHSHGGSVVANSVLDWRISPEYLSKIITIGTPYLTFRKSLFLFSRLGLMGKAALTCGFQLFIVTAITELVLMEHADGLFLFSKGVPYAALNALVPIFCIYCALHFAVRRRFRRYRLKTLGTNEKSFGERWVCLYDRNDEALLGLGFLGAAKINLFSQRFAVPAFSFISFFLLFGVLAIISASPHAMERLSHVLFFQHNQFDSTITNFIFLTFSIVQTLAGAFSKFGPPGAVAWDFFVWCIAVPTVFLITSIIITLIVTWVSLVISASLSMVLDSLTWRAIRRRAFGGDLDGETALDVAAQPAWARSEPLPAVLSEEITCHVNKETVKSLPRLRKSIYELAFSTRTGRRTDPVVEYLSWNELIHTAYFSVPRFRMLVAFVIAHSPGFRPSAAFKSHPDYELVARWYEEIQPKQEGLPDKQPSTAAASV